VINDAATYYIDEGRPIPGQFGETLRNLREVRPREFTSVPLFFAYLASAMEAEPALRDRFFSRLRLLSYSTAGLSQGPSNSSRLFAACTSNCTLGWSSVKP
jgi:feruloyl-CoA synthase